MAELNNLESILATLAAQKPTTTSTPPGGQSAAYPPPPAPGYPAQSQAPPGVSGAPGYPAAPPTASYPYPQPTSSGSLDLSAAVKPTSSGSVSIQEAIARAKAHAAQNGVTPYDRPITYAAAPPPTHAEPRRFRSSRSRSPPPNRRGGGDNYRENYNPYRDERREGAREYGNQERPYSPALRGARGREDGFSPRGGNGGGRPQSPGRGGGGGDNTETIEIKANLVGLIIGRQGENLKRVESESGCRVQFLSAANPEDATRQCKITGAPARRAEAVAAIHQIIEDNGMNNNSPSWGGDRGDRNGGGGTGGRFGGGGPGAAGGGGPGGPGFQPNLKEGEECLQIMIPDRTVGLIIGRGGETIRDLQERSGCHINIVGESKSVNGLRPVNLIGSRASTTQAKDLIMEIVDSDTRNGQAGGPGGGGGAGGPPFRHGGRGGGDGAEGGYGGGGGGYGGGGGDRVQDSIFVPSEAVGMIIGKGGETIREMQSQTSCKINVTQTSGANENEREIGLVGSREAIEQAKIAIEEKVEAVRQKNSGGGYHGGGGRGGRGGGGYQHRDYDNQGYGGGGGRGAGGAPGTGGGTGAGGPPGMGQPTSDDPSADPYAPYGGYAAYVALWYQAVAQQQGAGGAPPPAPGE